MIYHGDSLEVLKVLPDNSLDACVTDPPYGLKFMGKTWDYDVPKVELWREVLRVLKPGAHLLSFGGTRTYHRMVVAIEDAGFEIRDQIMWIYGSGFPKSHNVSKAIDKAAGAEREVIGQQNYSAPDIRGNSYDQAHVSDRERLGVSITAPATDLAKQWDGWGTALKPANEPIVLARKPLEKGLTVSENVLKWGCGALNVDGTRIVSNGDHKQPFHPTNNERNIYGKQRGFMPTNAEGRWPANVLFDEDAAAVLDEQTKNLHGAGSARERGHSKQNQNGGLFGVGQHEGNGMRFGDTGGASRFFYVAKASKRERNAGLEGMPEIKSSKMGSGIHSNVGNGTPGTSSSEDRKAQNFHPTVKPIKLMEYLIKLITPPNGKVLDPFLGSGSTLVAAKNLGFDGVGIELNAEYVEIAQKRIGIDTLSIEP